jgi:hypothetical protein
MAPGVMFLNDTTPCSTKRAHARRKTFRRLSLFACMTWFDCSHYEVCLRSAHLSHKRVRGRCKRRSPRPQGEPEDTHFRRQAAYETAHDPKRRGIRERNCPSTPHQHTLTSVPHHPHRRHPRPDTVRQAAIERVRNYRLSSYALASRLALNLGTRSLVSIAFKCARVFLRDDTLLRLELHPERL